MSPVKISLLLLLTYSGLFAVATDDYKLKVLERLGLDKHPSLYTNGQAESGEQVNQSVTVFIENLDNPFPIFNRKPLDSLVKGVGEQYKTIILDCMPLVLNFPPKFDDNIYFHIPLITAQLNENDLKENPVNIWIQPHLHIPFLDLEKRSHSEFATKPMNIALYMAKQANAIHPETITGVVITATPLLISAYREKIPNYRKVLHKRNLKLGLLIENYSVCHGLAGQVDKLELLLENFDQVYYHQPRIIQPEESTGNRWEDAILEGKAFEGLFEMCRGIFVKLLPKDKVVEPVRGFLSANYTAHKDHTKMKFRFDVVRF